MAIRNLTLLSLICLLSIFPWISYGLHAAIVTSPPNFIGETIDSPSYLKANAGDMMVELVWGPVKSAISYTAQRSDYIGGPYTVVKHDIIENHWIDTDIQNDHVYYYIVFAMGKIGKGPVSSEAIAKPTATVGMYPSGELAMGNDGWLYGVTSAGGRYKNGTLYRVKPDGTFETLYHFSVKQIPNYGSPVLYPGNADGAFPFSSLIFDKNGIGYGTTSSGGSYDLGTIFQYITNHSLITIHELGLGKDQSITDIVHNADGANPQNGVILGKDGNLYGTVSSGGRNGSGAVFMISREFDKKQKQIIAQNPKAILQTPPYNSYHILRAFSNLNKMDDTNKDGASPVSGLIQTSDGTLYGITSKGGKYGGGTLFAINTSGVFKTLYHFAPNISTFIIKSGLLNISTPSGPLLEGSNGYIYGVCKTGGDNQYGAVYSISKEGVISNIYSFDKHAEYPISGLSLVKRDIRYDTLVGTTSCGGDNGCGVVFNLQSDGVFKILTSLPQYCIIRDRLTVLPDGSYLGVSRGVPDQDPLVPYGKGMIIKIARDGQTTIIHKF